MKTTLMLGALLVSFSSYAMDDPELAEDSTNIPVHQEQYTQRIAIQHCSSPRGPKYGAKIEATSSSSYFVKYVPQPNYKGLVAIFIGSNDPIDRTPIARAIKSVIPGKNITLWENYAESYDVIYRREDGVVIAEDLATGEELYAVGLERPQGDGKEELLQSSAGTLLVINRDGTETILSHRALKNRVLSKNGEDDDSSDEPNNDK